MARVPRSLLLLAVSGAGLSGGCGAVFLFGEKALSDCDATAYEELEKQSFRLERRLADASPALSVVLRVYRDCRIDPGRDLGPLGVKEMYFRNPRSRSPELVLVLDARQADGTPAECTAVFQPEKDMVFSCPEGFYFQLRAGP